MTAPTMRFDALLLPGMDRAVGHARRWLRDVLGREHPCLDDAAVCMSELLTNALRYTESGRDGQIRLEVTYSARAVRIEVIDDGRAATVPHVAEAAELDVTGRGLLIVASIAKAWGMEQRGTGHAVWFELLAAGHDVAAVASVSGFPG